MKIIAMIPARMGSQRVKQKNIRLLNGKPLISHIVDTAVKSQVFAHAKVGSFLSGGIDSSLITAMMAFMLI